MEIDALADNTSPLLVGNSSRDDAAAAASSRLLFPTSRGDVLSASASISTGVRISRSVSGDNLHPQPAAGLNCVNLIVCDSMVTALSFLPLTGLYLD